MFSDCQRTIIPHKQEMICSIYYPTTTEVTQTITVAITIIIYMWYFDDQLSFCYSINIWQMCKLPSLRLMNNHDYPGVHPDCITQINHNLTTQEVIEEEIDFKNWSSCGLSMIIAHRPIIFLIRLMIIPPFESNWGDWPKAAIRLSNKIRTHVNSTNLTPIYIHNDERP